MTHAIAGKVYYGEKIITDLNHLRRVKETVKDVDQIDLFVWMQMNENIEIHQIRIMIQPKTKLMSQAIEIGKKL